MPFEHPHMTTVETKDLRFMLSKVQQVIEEIDMTKPLVHPARSLDPIKNRLEHVLGLDREVNHAQD